MSRIDRWPARAGVAACAAAMAMAPCVAQGTGRTLALVGTPGIGQTLTITETFPAPQSGKLNLWIVARPFAGAVPTPPPLDPVWLHATGQMRVDPADVFGPAPLAPVPFAAHVLAGGTTDALTVSVPNDLSLLGFAFDVQAVDLDLSTPAPWAAAWSDNDVAITIGPPSVARLVPPATTDPAITTFLDNHVAINPAPTVVAKGRLFVLLVGTGAKPENQQAVLAAGAARGYHAIGLMYPNTPSVGSLCGNSLDPDAFWDARREILTGQDLSPLLAISPVESIDHRLTALLAWLATNHPGEGWATYLAAGQADWSKVVVAGHSQGGGHAGVIGKLRDVARVVCFASPADWRNVPNAPATWYARPNVTPIDRWYGFGHLQDELVVWPRLSVIWSAMGLGAFGPPASVDGGAPPYGNSRQLTTNLPHAAPAWYPAPFHSATVVDLATPTLPGGAAVYLPVWSHICFP